MIGAIIGDIAGSRFEFDNHKSKDFELFADSCRPTDDSIMTIAVASAIMETEKIINTPDYRGDSEYYTLLEHLTVKSMQEIGRRYPDCGYGGSFYRWVFSNCPKPYNSFGNGAAMRVSPAGYAARTEDEARKFSLAITKVTHNHPEGIKGAQAVAVAIFMARKGFTKDEIRKKIIDCYYTLDFTIDKIRETYEFDETCQGTVPYAIEAFLESTCFEDAVRIAVSAGGDSDTLAAITGSIAQAYYGVPEELENKALSFLDGSLLKICNEWKVFAENSGKSDKFRVLTKYIRKIASADSFGSWVKDKKSDGSPQHPIQFPFINFSLMTDSFVKEFYQFSESHPEYRLSEYTAILKNNGLEWDGTAMRRADAAKLGAGCILALIMGAIRAEHFCDGALLKFFDDGSILRWLKRLREIDDFGKEKTVEEIYFETGGFFDKGQSCRIVFDANGATKISAPFEKKPIETRLCAENTKRIKNAFYALHTENWKSEYENKDVCDGEQWKLSVQYRGACDTVYSGSNAYPQNWADVLEFFDISDAGSVRIKKLILELDRNSRIDVKSIKNYVDWHYTESITLDHERSRLVIKQNISSGCAVTHEYYALDGIDSLMESADICMQSGEWQDTPKYTDNTGVRFYRLTAVYYGGSKVTHSGIYDRRGIPDEQWSKFIGTVFDFVYFYGFGELLDKNIFLNAGKDGEIKYCSVAFEKFGRTFYYRTDDESIEPGDTVIVPFGTANTERIGIVENIGYYSTDKVPFPLEKTKKILRKKED